MPYTAEPDRRPEADRDEAGEDPAIVLVHPLREPSSQVVLTVTGTQCARLTQLLTSRGVSSAIVPARDQGGLVEVQVEVGDDPQSVHDVADCLEILLQLLGRSVFGPLSDPCLVDVASQGRDVVSDEVTRAFAPLRPFLPAAG